MKCKYHVDDTVRVIGEKEVGQITNVGYSERMAEVIYIVSYKTHKRKVLESQIAPAQITVTIKEFDRATETVVESYVSHALNDMDDDQLSKLVDFIRGICSDLRGALFDD